MDFALLIDDPSLAKKRREEINQKNEAKRRELRRNVLGMLEVTNVKDKEEIYIHDDEIEPQRKFDDLTATEKCMYVLDLPFMIASYLTILPTHRDHFNRLRCLIWPIPGVAFWMFMFIGKPNEKWLYFGAPTAVIYLVIFFFFLPRDGVTQPSKPIAFFMNLTSSVSSCCWMYMLIQFLVDLLNTVGLVFNIESSYLGFTVLAVGNALPDALNTIALSKAGQAIMAISGAYNGQLFGLLIGFSAATIKNYIKEKKAMPFQLFPTGRITNNFIGLLVIFTALFILTMTWIWASTNQFKMSKTFARLIIAIYFTFIACATYFSFGRNILKG